MRGEINTCPHRSCFWVVDQAETGLRATSLIHLGHLFEAYGFSTQGFDVHLATGRAEGDPGREAGEQDMIHRAFADAEVATMIGAGQIVDAPSLAA